MKSLLAALSLCLAAVHAKDSASDATRAFFQESFQGDVQKATALLYLAPELLAHADKNTVLQELAQCLQDFRSRDNIALKRLREVSNDGQRAVLRATISNNGEEYSPPPFAAHKTADGWRVDLLSQLFTDGCENTDIGSPLPAVQAVIEAVAQEDAQTLATLVYIDYNQIDVPPDDRALQDRLILQMRDEIAALKAENIRITLAENTELQPAIKASCVNVPVMVHEGDIAEESALPMCKSARGWQIDDLFSPD